MPANRPGGPKRPEKVMVTEEKLQSPYHKPSTTGAYIVLLVALAIAGVMVFYIMTHREQFSRLWFRATHPDSLPAQVDTGL